MSTAAEVADALERLWKGEELRADDAPDSMPVLRIESIDLLPGKGLYSGEPYVGELTARFLVAFTLGGQHGEYVFEHPLVDLERYDDPDKAAKFLGMVSIWSVFLQWWSGKDFGELGPHLIEDQPRHVSSGGR